MATMEFLIPPDGNQLLYQLIAGLLTYAIIQSCLFFRARQKRYQLFKYYNIPGPEPNLLEGSLKLYREKPDGYRANEQLRKQYGDVFGIYICDEASIVISDLELIKTIYLERMSSFRARAPVLFDMPIAHSILFVRYSRWKMIRKVMSHPFSTYAVRGQESTQFVEDSVKLMLDYIEREIDPMTGKTANIDMHDLMKSTALHLISSMAMDLPDVQVREQEPNVKNLDEYLQSTTKPLVIWAVRLPFIWRCLALLSKCIEFDPMMAMIRRNLNKRIDQRKLAGNLERKANQRLIDTLIDFYHQGKITRKEVIGNAEAILFAGFDTTSTTLAYIFWVLGKNLDVQERLRRELMTHGMDSRYLEMVINEVMRLYPTVMSFTTRMATETVVINDKLTIPQGARVLYSNWIMSRDPKLWPEPEKFDPERFNENAKIHPCAFAPFGFGDRKCLGIQLALLELKMVVCDILMRYKVVTKAPEELDLISYATVMSKPKEKIMVELERLNK